MSKGVVSFLFLFAGLSVVWMFWEFGRLDYGWDGYVAIASGAILIAAGALGFLQKSHLASWLALVGAACAAPWFVWLERDLRPWNSWLTLNCPSDNLEALGGCGSLAIRLKLLAMVLTGAAVVFASSWLVFRKTRIWAELVVILIVLSTWFVSSVTPYRLPIIFDGVGPDLRILHVEKRGLLFHETAVAVYRDGKVVVSRVDRRWFRYTFIDRVGYGLAAPETQERVREFIESAALSTVHTPPPRALRSWNGEGWYVVTSKRRFSFARPPREVVDLFRELEGREANEIPSSPMRDICMGFCYDPAAALGLWSLRDRAWLDRLN